MKTVAYCTTRQWNPGDEFILLGVKNVLERLIGKHNSIIYNRNPEVRPAGGLTAFRNKKNEDEYRNDYIRTGFFDNSIKFDSDLSYVDLAVFAGTPEWQNERCLNFYKHIIKNNIPAIFLGIGSYKEPSEIVAEVLSKTNFISFRDSKFLSKIPENLNAIYLPCPALLLAPRQKEKHIWFVRHIGLGFAVTLDNTSKWNDISQETYNYIVDLYKKIIENEKCKVSIICHYIDEVAIAHKLFDKYGVDILYSYDSKDYIDIYSRFDLVISTRVHGCGISASMGIPTIAISHDFRGSTTKGFLSECITTKTVVSDVFSLITTIKKHIHKRNKVILKYKHNTMKQYVELLTSKPMYEKVKYKDIISTHTHDITFEQKLDLVNKIDLNNTTDVSFKYHVSRDTVLQLYYTLVQQQSFSETQSANIVLVATTEEGKQNIVIPYPNIVALRIDAGKPGDIITISNPTIKNQNLVTKLDVSKFTPVNMEVLEQTNDYIVFKPTTDDPQLVYKFEK